MSLIFLGIVFLWLALYIIQYLNGPGDYRILLPLIGKLTTSALKWGVAGFHAMLGSFTIAQNVKIFFVTSLFLSTFFWLASRFIQYLNSPGDYRILLPLIGKLTTSVWKWGVAGFCTMLELITIVKNVKIFFVFSVTSFLSTFFWLASHFIQYLNNPGDYRILLPLIGKLTTSALKWEVADFRTIIVHNRKKRACCGFHFNKKNVKSV